MNTKKVNMHQKAKSLLIKTIDAFSPLAGALSSSGGALIYTLTTTQVNVLCEVAIDIKDRLCTSKSSIVEKYVGQGIFCHDIVNLYPTLVKLIDFKLANLVKEYLGTGAYLDKISLFMIPLNESYNEGSNQSDIWHHDSVGHRVKVFFPLTLDVGNKSFHEYRKNSNFIKPTSYLNAVNEKGLRIDQIYDNFEVLRFKLEQGKALVIDTHGVHRGIYNSYNGIRASIQLEFSSKFKRYIRGYVGPVEYTLPEYVCDELKGLGLINPKLIELINKGVILHKGRRLMNNEKISIQELIKI